MACEKTKEKTGDLSAYTISAYTGKWANLYLFDETSRLGVLRYDSEAEARQGLIAHQIANDDAISKGWPGVLIEWNDNQKILWPYINAAFPVPVPA